MWIEPAREDHVRASVVASDDAEHDRPIEVHDGAADLGAVLELEPPQRFRGAVEARQVREHDDRPRAARGVDRARHLLRREREERGRGPLVRTVGRHEPEPRERPGLEADQADGDASQVGVPDGRDLRLAHVRPALERRVVLVDHGTHHTADLERLAAARVVLAAEDLADHVEGSLGLVSIREGAHVTIDRIVGRDAPRESRDGTGDLRMDRPPFRCLYAPETPPV